MFNKSALYIIKHSFCITFFSTVFALAFISCLVMQAAGHFTLETTDYLCACEDWHFDECSAGAAYGWPGRSFSSDPGSQVDDTMTIQYN